MTTAVWSIAGAGRAGKLFLPGPRPEVLGGCLPGAGLAGAGGDQADDRRACPGRALLLLVWAALLYSTGVIFYVNKKLKFRRAIWHGHVVAAAAPHWVAVLLGVVLASQH